MPDDIAEEAGYDVVTAVDGRAGLAVLESQRPDAIVSDVNMIVCTMMPGSANSTYFPVLPAIAPPKMYTKTTVRMMG